MEDYRKSSDKAAVRSVSPEPPPSVRRMYLSIQAFQIQITMYSIAQIKYDEDFFFKLALQMLGEERKRMVRLS